MEHMAVPSGESSRKREQSRLNKKGDKFMLSNTTLSTKLLLMGLHVACTCSSPFHSLLDPNVREDAWPWT